MALSKITPESINLASDFAGMGFGGTGAANQLDDYEEGTWTPTFTTTGTDFDSVTYDSQEGFYTKIGNMINVRLFIRTDAITVGSATGNVLIGGLPFSVDNNRNSCSVISDAYAGDHPSVGQVGNSGINLYYASAPSGDRDNPIQISDLGTGANNNETLISACYQAT